MKYFLSEKQLKVIEESWKKKEEDPIATHIRKCLKDVYKPLGFWGSIQNPDNNCETGEGVIRAYPHLAGEDEWSILNRFDTNTKVRDRIKQIFLEKNPGQELTSSSLIDFDINNVEGHRNYDYAFMLDRIEQIINETIRRLEEISKGYQESAKRMEKIIVKIDEIETLKKG